MPRVVHFEFAAENPEQAVTFYADVFGWQANKWDGPEDYWLLTTGEEGQPGINGAITRASGTPGRTVNVIDVPSVDEYIAKVVAHGGRVVAPKMPVPGVGYFAYCQDTEGNTFGMMQFDPAAT